jgi:hypothetical protein
LCIKPASSDEKIPYVRRERCDAGSSAFEIAKLHRANQVGVSPQNDRKGALGGFHDNDETTSISKTWVDS